MTDLEQIKAIVSAFDEGREALTKFAFTPSAPPAPPMTAGPQGGPPPAGDPGMAPPPPGAPMPPAGDPGMAPPPGAPMDPNAMPPGGAPPMDPNGAPPPPPEGGGVSPELENALSQLAGGMDTVSQAVEQSQAQTDQLAQRMLAMEAELDKMRNELKTPAPFEGGAGSAPSDSTAPEDKSALA